MPFQHASGSIAPTAFGPSDPLSGSSPTKEPTKKTRQRLYQPGGGRPSASRPRREQADRNNADKAVRNSTASAAVAAAAQQPQPPTDIAAALVAYQRRNARASDGQSAGGRARPSRRSGNREATEATGSSDEVTRDASATAGKPRAASNDARRGGGPRQAPAAADADVPGSQSVGSASQPAQDALKVPSPAAAARRSRQSSEKGVLPNLRAPERSRQESTIPPSAFSVLPRIGGFGQRERNSRTAEGRHVHAQVSQEFYSSVSRDGRQLFDPRRHDPVKFASQQRSQPQNAAGLTATHSGAAAPAVNDDYPRHLAINGGIQHNGRTGQQQSASTTLASESRVETFAVSQATASGLSQFQAGGPEISSSYTLQIHVLEIKQLYRKICALEGKLELAHRSEADEQRDPAPLKRSSHPLQQLNHDYWLRLASDHRELAELQSSFLEMTLRTDMPESVQELPRTYNLPTRLWQIGFHMMLERLRHSLPSAQQARSTATANCGSELLDHLTEFIYFAYAFYTTLYETEKFRAFRRAWIESLGDLARYRMAVAGLAASLSLDDDSGVRNKAERSTRRREAESMRIDDDDDGSFDEPPPADGASIGSDALGDWEFVEKETWRQTARDWYARGLAETPNVGRLHHHLGILSRNDELRALYHLCRSLTAAHPFASAKETILSLFDHEHQSRRLQGDASVEDLFVYLHGALISRVQLDDFDEVFTRLREKLGSEGVPGIHQRPLSEATCMVMAFINGAGLAQYGAEASVLMQSIARRSVKANETRGAQTDKGKAATPTAIMVNQAAAKVDDGNSHGGPFPQQQAADAWDDGSEDLSDAGDDVAVIQLDGKDDAHDHGSEEVPMTLTYALRLAFFMLEFWMQRKLDGHGGLNPYVTEFLTFVFSVVRYRPVYRLVERHMPWQTLVDLTRVMPTGTVIRALKDTPPYITGKYPLPEDWCLRGAAGVGKQTYDRALWKKSCASSSSSSLPIFRTETEVLDSEDVELHAKFLMGPSTGRGDRSMSLDDLRLHRVAFLASRLAKTTRGLELDLREAKFSIGKPLLAKLSRWKAEEEQQKLEAQLEMLKVSKSLDLSSRNSLLGQEDLLSGSESDDCDTMDAIEGESDEVRQLRERKRYLKSVLRSTKAIMETGASSKQPDPAFSSSRGGGSGGSRQQALRTSCSKAPVKQKRAFSFHSVLPGYTVLLMDTNVLVTPGDLLKQLVESHRWTIVIPLAVVTELDGLKRNANALGEEAARAIAYLENHIRSDAKYLKVQTSRGNYLTDLSIRLEDMNLGLSTTTTSGQQQGEDAATTSKSLAARNVDEVIIRCLGWQTDHFVDRLALLTAHPAAERLKLEPDTAKAALLTLDRNLRVKAKARGLCGLDEQDIAELMIITAEETLRSAPSHAVAVAGSGSSGRKQREAVS